MVGSLPANAGDAGSSPGLGGSHMPQSAWAREPQLLSLRVWSLCSATGEAVIVRGPRTAMKSGPRSPQLEKALAQKRRPNTAKNFLKINKNLKIHHASRALKKKSSILLHSRKRMKGRHSIIFGEGKKTVGWGRKIFIAEVALNLCLKLAFR